MCRNIKILFNFDPPVTEQEIRNASLQFVRKISGFSKPSKANEAVFQGAVDEIAEISSRLLRSLQTNSSPRNREEEAAKAATPGTTATNSARNRRKYRIKNLSSSSTIENPGRNSIQNRPPIRRPAPSRGFKPAPHAREKCNRSEYISLPRPQPAQ